MLFKFSTCYFVTVHKNIHTVCQTIADLISLDELISKQAPARAEQIKAISEKSLVVSFSDKNKKKKP